MITIPNPENLTWEQWANTVCGFNETFGQYVNPRMTWPKFAEALGYLIPQTPRPQLFRSWQAWACALQQVV